MVLNTIETLYRQPCQRNKPPAPTEQRCWTPTLLLDANLLDENLLDANLLDVPIWDHWRSNTPHHPSHLMSLDQLKRFLGVMENDPALRQEVVSAATADDVAQIGLRLGYEFSGDELLRLSGQRVGRVTVTKQDIPGEYN